MMFPDGGPAHAAGGAAAAHEGASRNRMGPTLIHHAIPKCTHSRGIIMGLHESCSPVIARIQPQMHDCHSRVF